MKISGKKSMLTVAVAFVLAVVMALISMPQEIVPVIASSIENRSQVSSMSLEEPYAKHNIKYHDKNLRGKSEEYDETEIIAEDVSKRTETSKTFVQVDGTFVMQDYGIPVHYLQDEEYLEIDNTLNKYRGNTSNSFRVNFSDGKHDEIVRISDDLGRISIVPISNNENKVNLSEFLVQESQRNQLAPEIATERNLSENLQELNIKNDKLKNRLQDNLDKNNSSVLYANVLDGVDIEYILEGKSLKENIIVNSPQESYEFKFELSIQDLFPQVTAMGDIIIFDENGNERYIIPKGYMVDACGNYSNDVDYKLESKEDSYILSVIANEEFFEKASFPVVIDPTIIQLTHDINSMDLGYYWKKQNGSVLNTYFRAGDDKNAFVSLNKPNVKDIVYNYSIVSATFDVSYYTQGAIFTTVFHAKLKETLNFNYDELYLASDLTTDTDISFGNIDNNTVRIYVHNYLLHHLFESVISIQKVAGDSGDKNFHTPILTIVYSEVDSTITQDLGSGGTGVVNLSTGGLNYLYESITTNSDGHLPISISHIYDKSFGNTYKVGTNYKLNYQQRVGAEQGYNYYQDASGKKHYFSDDDVPQNYTLGLKYYKDTSTGFTRLIDKQGNSIIFNSLGLLLQIHQYPSMYESPVPAMMLSFAYNGNNGITTISNGKTTITLEYYPSGYLACIKHGVEVLAQYGYQNIDLHYASKFFTQIEHRTYFEYYNNAMLKNVLNGSGEKVAYTYNNINKIQSVSVTNNTNSLSPTVNTVTVEYKSEPNPQLLADTAVSNTTILSAGSYYRHVSFGKGSVVADYAYEQGGNSSYTPMVASSNGFNYTSFIDTFANAKTLCYDGLNPAAFHQNISRIYDSSSGAWNSSLSAAGTHNYAVSVWVNQENYCALPTIVATPNADPSKKVSYVTNGSVNGWQFVTLILEDITNLTSVKVDITSVHSGCYFKVSFISVIKLPPSLTKSKADEFKPEYDAFDRLVRTYHYNMQDDTITMLERYYFPGTGGWFDYPDLVESVLEYTVPASAVQNSTAFKNHQNGHGATWKSRTVYTYSGTSVGYLTAIDVYRQGSGTPSSSVQYTYDTNTGVLESYTDASGVKTSFDNNNSGAVVTTVAGADPIYGGSADITTINTYKQGTGLLTSTAVGSIQTNFLYHDDGSLYYILHNGFGTRFTYEGNNVKTIGFDHLNLVYYDYNANDTLSAMAFANGQTINYGYDSSKRLTGISHTHTATPTSISYGVDTMTVSNASGVIYNYAQNQQSVNYRYQMTSNNYTLKADYASYGNAWNQTDNSYYLNNGLMDYYRHTYNRFGQIENTYRNANMYTDYGYDTNQRLDSQKLALGGRTFTNTYQYKTNGSAATNLVSNEQYKVDNVARSNYSYTYYKNGNLESVIDMNMNNGSGDWVLWYYYDQYNRLVREYNRYSMRIYDYTYDNGGNMTGKIQHDMLTGQNNVAIDTFSYANSWADQLSHHNGQLITYDNVGNPITSKWAGEEYVWQNGRELAGMKYTYNNSMFIQYEYDYNSVRTSKTINGTTTRFYLEGTRVWAETVNGALNKWYYYDASGIQGMWLSGYGEYYFEKNILGDVVGLYNTAGYYVGGYRYDAWGNIVAYLNEFGHSVGKGGVHPAVTANPFRYRSYYFDNETNFYYLQSRYYDPAIGRFLNADDPKMLFLTSEVVGGANLYIYCLNNPVMLTDSTGGWFVIDDLIAIGIGAVVGVTGQFVGDLITSLVTGKWQFSSWEMYTGAAIGGALGGWLTLYAGPNVGVGVGMGLQTFIGMGLEKWTGTNDHSWGSIAGMTALSAGIGFATAGLGKFAKIPGITKGSHSFQQVWRSGVTKTMKYGFSMSLKTVGKGIVSELVSAYTVGWLVGNIAQGAIKGATINWDAMQNRWNSGLSILY